MKPDQTHRSRRRSSSLHEEDEASRRTVRLAQRRRRRRFTAVLGALGVIVLGGAAYLYATMDEPVGPGATAGSTSTTAVTEAPQRPLLVVSREDEILGVVYPVSTASVRTVVGVPQSTLLLTQGGFYTVSQLADGDPEGLAEGLAGLLTVAPTGVARTEWTALRQALEVAGAAGMWPSELDADPGAAETLARAVSELGRLSSTPPGQDSIRGLELEGEGAALRIVLEQMGAGWSSAPWTAALLPGDEVDGGDQTYYEPDQAESKVLLGVATDQRPVEVQVQDGSGILGVAGAVSDLLVPLGYTLLPATNAPGFPNVAVTVVLAAEDVLAEAANVREVVGQGKVVLDASVPAGRIVVVLGSDYLPPSDLTTTTAALSPGASGDVSSEDGV